MARARVPARRCRQTSSPGTLQPCIARPTACIAAAAPVPKQNLAAPKPHSGATVGPILGHNAKSLSWSRAANGEPPLQRPAWGGGGGDNVPRLRPSDLQLPELVVVAGTALPWAWAQCRDPAALEAACGAGGRGEPGPAPGIAPAAASSRGRGRRRETRSSPAGCGLRSSARAQQLILAPGRHLRSMSSARSGRTFSGAGSCGDRAARWRSHTAQPHRAPWPPARRQRSPRCPRACGLGSSPHVAVNLPPRVSRYRGPQSITSRAPGAPAKEPRRAAAAMELPRARSSSRARRGPLPTATAALPGPGAAPCLLEEEAAGKAACAAGEPRGGEARGAGRVRPALLPGPGPVTGSACSQ